MKTINYTFVLICLLMANLNFAQDLTFVNEMMMPPPVITCADFELRNGQSYHAGWHGENAYASFASPSMDGSQYRRATGLPGQSYLYNSLYPENLSKYRGQCLCFDFKVYYDGIPQSVMNINPTIILFDGHTPSASTIQAKFVANITVTENDDWVHVCAPIEFSNGSALPSNDHGTWTNVTAAQWDALLTNVGSIGFSVDAGGPRSIDATIGIDNVCIQDCEPFDDNGPDGPDTLDGAYCCDGENLVTNGNFESNAGYVAFMTMYDNNSNLYPGQYQITNTAAAFGASVTDHSYCTDPVMYPNNNRFMVVNGRTQQSGNAVIWSQIISGLEEGKTYKFCANFKNMPQCTFDILPNVNLTVNGIGSSGFSTISADPNNACDWINKEFVFTATSSSVRISIDLDETGNGDGNDLAIDDISVSELIEAELDITVQHQGNTNQITASINTIDTSDDHLPGSDKCEYHWYAVKVNSFPPLNVDMNTFASGNYSGNDTGNGNSPWNLTTTFPDYNFDPNSMYLIGMYIPACDCYDESFTYQLTYNNRSVDDGMMSDELKQEIIDLILNGRPNGGLETTSNRNISEKGLNVYPNPSKGNFNLSLQGDSLQNVEIFSITGQSVFTKTYGEGKVNDEIDISSFSSGMYIIKAQGKDGKQYNTKVVKE